MKIGIRQWARLAAVACAPWLVTTVAAADLPRRPDIVIFLTDDLGYLDTTPYGARDIRTPNIQRLADGGLTFTRAYVASPTCAPSRGALLTGMMPARNGAEANHSRPRADIKKWPAYFQELGYEVVAYGKVGHYKQTAEYGFDSYAHIEFHDDAAIPAAAEFLRKRPRAGAKPLCLFVGSNWPHVPWPEMALGYYPAALTLPAGGVDTPETRAWRARYAAAVTLADNDLGLVQAAVWETLGDDVLWVFSSDNGAQWPFGKWNCYEAGVRTPLIVAWPGVVKPGRQTDAVVSWVDLLPTMLEAAGGAPPDGIDGRSFLRLIRGEADAHRDRIFSTHSGDGRWNVYPIRSVRYGGWSYILNLHPEYAFTTHIDLPGNLGQRPFFSTWETAARTNADAAAALKRYHARPAEELYDLAADPFEQKNRADDPACTERLKEMRAGLEKWMNEQGDQRTVFAEPRLLRDPSSYGPDAPPGNAPLARRLGGGGKAFSKPPIVFLFADQLRASATGYGGDPNVRTPNLDRLAKESVSFRNAVSVCPVCCPHRASLITGRFPTSTGIFLNDAHLPEREVSIAEALAQAGYDTAYIGKWHLDGHGRDGYIPPERRQGFQYWKAAECDHDYNRSHYYTGTNTAKQVWPGYDAFAQTRDAQQYLLDHARAGKPFVLFVSYGIPHFPHGTAPEKYRAMYPPESIRFLPNVPEAMRTPKVREEARGYYAHTTALDDCVGELLKTLAETGLDREAILVFTSDHGETMGSHGVPPLTKQVPWDEAARVPFLLRYPPAHGAKAREVATPLTTPDIMPTLLTLAGVPIPASVEGRDLSAVVREGRELPDHVGLYMGVAPFAGKGQNKEYRAIRTDRHTYVRGLEGPWLLFDDQADPYQTNNLALVPAHARLRDDLDRRLQAALKGIRDDFRPAAFYVEKFGYELAPHGSISYAPGARPQTPKPQP